MQILITGTPGTGKTRLAKKIAKKFKLMYVNELEFARKNGCIEYNRKEKEFEVDLKKLQKNLQEFLKKTPEIIVEGHLLCEIKLRVDKAILLKVKPKILEKRLSKRPNYSMEKVLDNVFCEEIGYCEKHAKKNYSNLLIMRNDKAFKEVEDNIIKKLNEASK